MYISISLSLSTYIYIYICMCVYIYIYICIYIHIYIHTHTHRNRGHNNLPDLPPEFALLTERLDSDMLILTAYGKVSKGTIAIIIIVIIRVLLLVILLLLLLSLSLLLLIISLLLSCLVTRVSAGVVIPHKTTDSNDKEQYSWPTFRIPKFEP